MQPKTVTSRDILSLLEIRPRTIGELCVSIGGARTLVERRIELLLSSGVVYIDTAVVGETYYVMAPSPKTEKKSEPLNTSIASNRPPPNLQATLSGYSSQFNKFRELCLRARSR